MSSTQSGGGNASPPAAPRWVKVFGILVLLFLLAGVVHLAVRGPMNHGAQTQQGGNRP